MIAVYLYFDHPYIKRGCSIDYGWGFINLLETFNYTNSFIETILTTRNRPIKYSYTGI